MLLPIVRTLSWLMAGSVVLLYNATANGASDELVKAATKEGSLMIYGTTQIDHMHALIKHFNQKYPPIKANYHRQGTTRDRRTASLAACPEGRTGVLFISGTGRHQQ